MAYIGKTPIVGNFQKCDALSASGTADYTLQVGSTNVVPESVNHMIVSLNGVIQSPTTAYTVAGAVLSFASALTTSDTIDFVMLLGNVLDIGTPSDDTVTGAKIVDDAINSEHYTDGSIDTAHIADDQITLAKMASGTDGNVISYDASGNPAAVATGSSGQVLTSAGAGAPPTFASLSAGKVGQIVSAIKTDTANTTSTTAVTTGLAVTITPTATSSKILLQANIGAASNVTANNRTFFKFNGGNTATYIGDAATGHETVVGFVSHRTSYDMSSASMTYLDSPATTSATTYTVYYWGDGGTTYFNGSPTVNGENGNAASSITAIEVLA